MLVCLAVVMFKSISVEENLIEISEIGIIKALLFKYYKHWKFAASVENLYTL